MDKLRLENWLESREHSIKHFNFNNQAIESLTDLDLISNYVIVILRGQSSTYD